MHHDCIHHFKHRMLNKTKHSSALNSSKCWKHAYLLQYCKLSWELKALKWRFLIAHIPCHTIKSCNYERREIKLKSYLNGASSVIQSIFTLYTQEIRCRSCNEAKRYWINTTSFFIFLKVTFQFIENIFLYLFNLFYTSFPSSYLLTLFHLLFFIFLT